MNVSDAMTPRSEVVTVELPGNREDALEVLRGGSFSSVPVVKPTDDGEQFRGLISRERLIEHPDEDQLALLMEEVPTITADADLRELAELMLREDQRRVPVVDGRLEGIVTVTDVIRAIAEDSVDGDVEVGELATGSVNTVYAGAPLAVGERELFHANVPYAVVLDEDAEMCGVFTEVDVIEVAEVVQSETQTGDSIAGEDDDWMWEGIKGVGSRAITTRNVEFPDGTVEEYMTADVVTVARHKSAREAAQLMLTHDVEQLPLINGGDLIGVVRDVDLLGALAEDER